MVYSFRRGFMKYLLSEVWVSHEYSRGLLLLDRGTELTALQHKVRKPTHHNLIIYIDATSSWSCIYSRGMRLLIGTVGAQGSFRLLGHFYGATSFSAHPVVGGNLLVGGRHLILHIYVGIWQLISADVKCKVLACKQSYLFN